MASDTDEPAQSASDAFVETFSQMVIYAIGVLVDRGVLSPEDFNAITQGDWWAHIEDKCTEYLEAQPDVDDFAKPRRVDVAAAFVILKHAEVSEALAEVSERATSGGLSADDLCGLLSLGAELGALGEVFRADLGGFDPGESLRQLKERPAVLGAAGGRKRRESADKWRGQAVAIAIDFRGSNGGGWGWDTLTDKVKAGLAERGIIKSADTVERLLKASTEPEGPIPRRRS